MLVCRSVKERRTLIKKDLHINNMNELTSFSVVVSREETRKEIQCVKLALEGIK